MIQWSPIYPIYPIYIYILRTGSKSIARLKAGQNGPTIACCDAANFGIDSRCTSKRADRSLPSADFHAATGTH